MIISNRISISIEVLLIETWKKLRNKEKYKCYGNKETLTVLRAKL